MTDRLKRMRRHPAVAVIGAAVLIIAALWVVTGALAARTRPDLGGLVTIHVVTPPTSEPASTSAGPKPTPAATTSTTTRDHGGAHQVTPVPDCPAGQTVDEDEDDPGDRCDD